MNDDATPKTAANGVGSSRLFVPVYVDAAVWPYGRMMMCHMISEDLDALHAMAKRIGVQRKWFQCSRGLPHYDICKAKRALAVTFGAIELEREPFVQVIKKVRAAWADGSMLKKQLDGIENDARLLASEAQEKGDAETVWFAKAVQRENQRTRDRLNDVPDLY